MGAAGVRHSGSLIVVALAACHRSTEPDAPPVVATADLGGPALIGGYHATADGDGNLVALVDDAVVGVASDGHRLWRDELHHHGWLVPIDDRTVLTSDDQKNELVILDRATGAVKQHIAIPAAGAPDDEVSAENAVTLPGGPYGTYLIALSDGRFFTLGKGFEQRFQLADEVLIEPDLIPLPMPSTDFLLVESDTLRRLSLDGTVHLTVRAYDSIGGAAPLAGDRAAVVVDDDLVYFDLAACATAHAPVRLAKKPGKLYDEDADSACDDCVLPPPGCVVATPELGDVDAAPPTQLTDGSLIVTDDSGITRLAPDGTITWRSDAVAFGPVRVAGDTVYVLTSTFDDGATDAPVHAVALDASNGHTRWSRELPATAGLLVSYPAATVELAGPWLIAGYLGKLGWLRVSPS